jgi:hypothetical protein
MYTTLKRNFLRVQEIIDSGQEMSEVNKRKLLGLVDDRSAFDNRLKSLVEALKKETKWFFTRAFIWVGEKIRPNETTAERFIINDIEFWKLLCKAEKDSQVFHETTKMIKSQVIDLLSNIIQRYCKSIVDSTKKRLSMDLQNQLESSKKEQEKNDCNLSWKFLRENMGAALNQNHDKNRYAGNWSAILL